MNNIEFRQGFKNNKNDSILLLNAFFEKLIIAICLTMLPCISMAKDSDLYLFGPNQITKGEITQFLRNEGLLFSKSIEDTVTVFSKDYVDITVGFCPRSELIYSYTCNWSYRDNTDDVFSSQNNYNANICTFSKSEQYFICVHDTLLNKYGKPTKAWIHKDGVPSGVTITDKNQLDTLSFESLFNKKCYFQLYWENSERIVRLSFDNTYRESYEYIFLDLKKLALRDEETAKSENIRLFSNIVIGVAVVAVIFLIFYLLYKNAKEKEIERSIRINELAKKYEKQELERKEIEEKEKRQKERELKESESIYNNYFSSLTQKWGNCDKKIRIPSLDNSCTSEILVFSESKHLVIDKRELLFSDILDCSVNDDIKEKKTIETYRGNSTALSKADTGSLLGRSIVGGVLAGNAGAIIGGSTAKRQTVIKYGTDTTLHSKEIEHNYTIAITIRDIVNPIIYLNVGRDTALKDEIVGLMKVIISMH